MAYADYEFYTGSYYGDTLTEDNAAKWLEMASDELDTFTFGRLTFAFPEVEAHAVKVRKAVCAMADALYQIDVQYKAAAAQQAADGSLRGPVASVSSGRESISYSTGNTSASVYALAAASDTARLGLLSSIAVRYISGIPDAKGVNLLYAGGAPFV